MICVPNVPAPMMPTWSGFPRCSSSANREEITGRPALSTNGHDVDNSAEQRTFYTLSFTRSLMLDIGSFPTRTCGTIGRRSFLRLAASVPLGLGLGQAAARAAEGREPRAKSVIFVFLWGGPSHLDTCDPKPDAPVEYRGPFHAIATRTPGLAFTELVPRIAERSHRYSIIRTHATTEPGHPDAGTVALTGFKEFPAPVQPNFGSIIAKHRGGRGLLPPFISLARGVVMDSGRRIEGYGGGTLSQAYDPMLVGCSAEGEVEIPALTILDGLNPARIHDRTALMRQLDAVPQGLESIGFNSWSRNFQSAYDLLLTPESRRAFDLTRESEATRARYGYTVFGQTSLLARRLVEAGVPYLQLNYSRHPEALNPG